jgi:hypothetical protein
MSIGVFAMQTRPGGLTAISVNSRARGSAAWFLRVSSEGGGYECRAGTWRATPVDQLGSSQCSAARFTAACAILKKAFEQVFRGRGE